MKLRIVGTIGIGAVLALPFLVLTAIAWNSAPATWLLALAIAQFALLAGFGRVLKRALAARTSDEVIGLRAAHERLTRVVAEIQDGTASVADGSAQIQRGSGELSRRAGEQASSLAEVGSNMKALTDTMTRNAGHARQALQLVEDAHSRAAQSAEIVSRTIGAMDEISSSSGKIASIIGVIDGIAFQTNLLALNAAVEAARAGAQGRSFAVVAVEVRSLAGRSALAAKEIKGLIENSVHYAREGETLVEHSCEALAELVGAVKEVKTVVAEIVAASKVQSHGIEQVNGAILRLEAAVRENATIAAQSEAAARSLCEQSREIEGSVGAIELGRSPARHTAI